MASQSISIQWSNRIDLMKKNIEQSVNPYLNLREAVYMYVCAYKTKKTWIVEGRSYYIGQSFRRQNNETVRHRLLEHFDDGLVDYVKRKCKNTSFVKVGKIILARGERFSQQLVDDIECGLVFKNKPYRNVSCAENYIGRDLIINNTGSFIPLEKRSVCKESKS